MNKTLFLVLTVISLILLMFVSDYTSASYLLSDNYIPQVKTEEDTDDEYINNAMPLEEYKQKIKNGEDPGIDDPAEMPIEIQLIQANSFMLRIFIFVLSVVLSIFAAIIIKSRRIEFSVMALNSDERAINMVRIGLYVVVAMSAYLNSQKYPFTFVMGWVTTLLWMINMLAIMIWIFCIIYAFKERKKFSGKTLKPLRK